MLKISIKSKHFNCDLELRKKVTVIQGLSGTGKTRMCEALADVSGAYSITVSDPSYVPTLVPNKGWYEFIDDSIAAKRRHVFIIDDASYVSTRQFSEIYSREKYSFFILISRFDLLADNGILNSWNQIPFSIDEIYTLESTGINHFLCPLLKSTVLISNKNSFDTVTEDSNAGYQFFSSINSYVQTSKGKDNLPAFLHRCGHSVLLLVDQAALGSKYSILQAVSLLNSQIFYLPVDYLSFEYMLTKSRMLLHVIPTITNEDICAYASHEQLYTAILENVTKGTLYKYDKLALNSCYLQDCCHKSQKQIICSVGISGCKKISLFGNTEWQQLIELLLNKSDSKVSCYQIGNTVFSGQTNLFA